MYMRQIEDETAVFLAESDAKDSDDEALVVALRARPQVGGRFNHALRSGRVVLRAHRRLHALRLKELERRFQRWQQENGEKLLSELIVSMPHIVHLASHTIALPPKLGMQVFDFRAALASVVGCLW